MPQTTKPLPNCQNSERQSESMRPVAAIRSRRAATILEVLFAIFVVIVGLMGIASLLPLAGRNAQQSNDATNALTLGRIWENEFIARGMNNPSENTDNAVGFNWLYQVDGNAAQTGLALFNKNPASTTPNLSEPGHSALIRNRTWQQMSVCIDPLFMAEPDVVSGFASGTARAGAFRAAVFPYYEHGYNPTEDAAKERGRAPWPDQPRMLRVTLGGGGGQIPQLLARELFQSTDGLAMLTDDTDKTIPASRSFSFTSGLDGTIGPNKQSRVGDYSWFATLSPEFSATPTIATDDYVLSLIILGKRDLGFASEESPLRVGSESSRPQGERVVWVHPLSGNFVGGNSGRVRLIGNSAMNDQVQIGNWIMLSKHVAFADATTGYSVFRWFRVIQADAEPRRGLLANLLPAGTDPFGNSGDEEVWSRDVVLEGPDWAFFYDNPADPTRAPSQVAPVATGGLLPAPTTGTLMSHIITVIERNVHVD